MKKAVYICTIVLLLVIFGVSAFMVGNYFWNAKKQADSYSDLAALKESAKETQPTVPASTDPTDPEPTFGEADIRNEDGMLKEYAEVYALNDDLVGWIRMEGTKMDYPVMQTPDNRDYYLKRNFDKEASDWGAIYIREECDINKPSDNITVYGHNMKDGSMFACLGAYYDKAAWENNPLIFFDTLTESHVYKIFAVFKTTAALGEGFSYHQFVDAANEDDFDDFIATCKDLAFYETGITPVYGDKIICLSTCEYTLEHGRLVVAAVRIA